MIDKKEKAKNSVKYILNGLTLLLAVHMEIEQQKMNNRWLVGSKYHKRRVEDSLKKTILTSSRDLASLRETSQLTSSFPVTHCW